MVPALALADVLTARGYEVHFCGGPRGMEGSLVPRAGYSFTPVRIRGFERHLGVTTLRTLASLPTAALDAWKLLARLRPSAVIGVGAYASGPVVAEAAVRRIPTVAVEMDAHLGWTNRILGLLVDRVCLSFPLEEERGKKFVYTGRPLRPALLAATREDGLARFRLDASLPVVLVFGGSLGARSLNDAALAAWSGRTTAFSLLHVTGERDFERVRSAVAAGGKPRYQTHAYLDDFPLALAATDVAVGRAGGSVAELLARGVPSVLVPYPHATADHQTKNARTLEEAGAAACVPDEEVTGIRLAGEVERLLEPETWERMHQAALALARPDAAERIVEQIVSLTGPQPAAKEVVAP